MADSVGKYTGTVGYDISFVRRLQTPDGWKIRILTNRPITFGEAWTDSRSMDYNLSAIELDMSDQREKAAESCCLSASS